MKSERESQLGICYECSTKDSDSSQKQVCRCDLCEKWFCEKHLKLKFPFFVDWDTVFDVQGNPEIKALYHTEYQREGGHPDFVYWRRNFEALDIEKKTRNQLIKQAIDRMTDANRKKKIAKSLRETRKKERKQPIDWNVFQRVHNSEETRTTANKYNYCFSVPIEVYSDKDYYEKLNNAKTLDEVSRIVNDFCRLQPRKQNCNNKGM